MVKKSLEAPRGPFCSGALSFRTKVTFSVFIQHINLNLFMIDTPIWIPICFGLCSELKNTLPLIVQPITAVNKQHKTENIALSKKRSTCSPSDKVS